MQEEDCRRATAEEQNVPEIHINFMFVVTRSTSALVVAREREREDDESFVQLGGAEEADVAAWRNRTGVREHHRAARL